MLTEKGVPARMRAVSVATRLALAAVMLAALSDCTSTAYLLQAANGEWHVIHGRKPIVQVIDDPQTPEPMIRELADVREARGWPRVISTCRTTTAIAPTSGSTVHMSSGT